MWKEPNTELQLKNLQPIVKHGGRNVMIWGCMAYNDVANVAFIETIMNAEKYIEVLRSNLSEIVIKLNINETYYFQQDNDTKHTTNKTKEWLLVNILRQLITPHSYQTSIPLKICGSC